MRSSYLLARLARTLSRNIAHIDVSNVATLPRGSCLDSLLSKLSRT